MDFNIAQTLTQSALAHPHQQAVIYPLCRDQARNMAYTHLSYAQLDAASDRLARGFLAHGIGHGMRAAFLVKPSLEFFVTTFALFKAGAVPVLIDPGLGRHRMQRCLAEAEAQAFIGIPAAHAARILLNWQGGGWQKKVCISRRSFPGTLSLRDLEAAGDINCDGSFPKAEAESLAAILFTSGSTGAPKGAEYTHGNFLAQIHLLKTTLGIEPGERDLCTFPLFALFAPALGMTAVIPQMDFTRPGSVNPELLAEAIHNFGITTMFGSPALIKRLAEYGSVRAWSFPSLKRVVSAGAPVPAKLIRMLRLLLPRDCKVYTPYGATEALPVAIAESLCLLGEAQSLNELGRGICVGTVAPETELRIIAIDDKSISTLTQDMIQAPGTIGEIVVSGAQVTRRYYGQPRANTLSKIDDPLHGRCFHRMGDLGYLDEQGLLWFCGRKSHRVQTGDGTLFTINCEAIFNRHPKVARSALVGVGSAGSEIPVLLVETLKPVRKGDQAEFFAELRNLGREYTHTQRIEHFLIHQSFPVDVRHNSKIFREKLKLWTEAQWQKKSWLPAVAAFSAKP